MSIDQSLRCPSSNTLQVCLLGPVQVKALYPKAANIDLAGQSRRLLTYLSLYDQPIRRETMIGSLYPDVTDRHARRLLADALYNLRESLVDAGVARDCISTANDCLGLADDAVNLDLHEFRRLARKNNTSAWLHAIDLYRGPVACDLDEVWLAEPQQAWHDQYTDLLRQTCSWLLSNGQTRKALKINQRWVQADPLNEQAHRQMMRSYGRLGQYALAIQHYEQFEANLQRELSILPSRRTRELAHALIREASLSPAHKPSLPPYVGRTQERAVIVEALNQAQNGTGRLVLIEGESGMGKSRLLDEIATSARWRGMAIARANASPKGTSSPLSPLTEALQTAVTPHRADQLRTLLPSNTCAVLGHMVPALMLNSSQTETQANHEPDLAYATTEGIAALARIRPMVLLLDDVQWADITFWKVLEQCLSRLHEMHLAVILTYNRVSTFTNPIALQTIQDIDTRFQSISVVLGGLTPVECSEMGIAMGYSIDERRAIEIHQHTGGNPLFVREFLNMDQTELDKAPCYPPTFAELIRQKRTMLSPAARALLETGAILGDPVRFEVLNILSGSIPMSAVHELLQLQLLTESEDGYHFQHELVRQIIYEGIDDSRRRNLHLEAAQMLAHRIVQPGIVAWHFEQAGQVKEAIRFHTAAGEAAESLHAFQTAIQHYDSALGLTHYKEAPDEMQIDYAQVLDLLCRRMHIFSTLHQITDREDDVQEILHLAKVLNQSSARLQALRVKMALHAEHLEVDHVLEAAREALELARLTQDTLAEKLIASECGWLLVNYSGRTKKGLSLLRHAARLCIRQHDMGCLIQALCSMAFAEWNTGHAKIAQTRCLRALTVIDQHPEIECLRGSVLQQLAMTWFEQGDWASAHRNMSNAIRLTIQTDGSRAGVYTACLDHALILSGLGLHKDAVTAVEESRASLRDAGFADHCEDDHMSEAILALIHLEHNCLDDAAVVIASMSDWIKSIAKGRMLMHALTARGQLYIAQGNLNLAFEDLQQAIRLWKDKRSNMIMPLLLHSIVAHQLGHKSAAHRSLVHADRWQQNSDSVRFLPALLYTRYIVTGDIAALRAAHDEINRQASHLNDDRLAYSFLNEPRIHREVMEQWHAHLRKEYETTIVRLARVDAPLGKALCLEDYVEVCWTVDAGEEDANILRSEGPVALRKHRLQRLLGEAQAQSAAPTDQNIADALGVSCRTIERDMASFRQQGRAVVGTRRRLSIQAG